MEFRIINGLNICTIGKSEFGAAYLRFNAPLRVVWGDNAGSVGQYLSMLPYNEMYRAAFRKKIHDGINEDYTYKVWALHQMLTPLWPLFPNGNYLLNFYSHKDKRFFLYKTSKDDYSQTHVSPLNVLFSTQVTDIAKQYQVRAKYENKANKNIRNILDNTCDSYYPFHEGFYATMPTTHINKERVKYFKKRLKMGDRPFILIFEALVEEMGDGSPYFILDGHHKLMAYLALNIHPPVALITQLVKTYKDIEFDTELLSKHLYPWQFEHLMDY